MRGAITISSVTCPWTTGAPALPHATNRITLAGIVQLTLKSLPAADADIVFARDGLGYVSMLLVRASSVHFVAAFDGRMRRVDALSAAPVVPVHAVKAAADHNLLCITTAVGFETYAIDAPALATALSARVDGNAQFEFTTFALVSSSKFLELHPLAPGFARSRCAIVLVAHHKRCIAVRRIQAQSPSCRGISPPSHRSFKQAQLAMLTTVRL